MHANLLARHQPQMRDKSRRAKKDRHLAALGTSALDHLYANGYILDACYDSLGKPLSTNLTRLKHRYAYR